MSSILPAPFRGFLILSLLVISLGRTALPAAATDPTPGAIARALTWLHTQQRYDGGFGGVASTADAVYTLALLGENPDGPAWTVNGRSALDALETLSAADPIPYPARGAGEAGKVLRAVALAGGNPHSFARFDLVALIETAYDPATGRYEPDYLYRHTLAVEGLLRAVRPVPAKAYDALFAAQLPDGSWNWSFDATDGDVDATGRVMFLLAGLAGQSRPDAYDHAADYLDAAQLASAGWGVNPAPDPNPANANSTALAVAGLEAAGFDPEGERFRFGCWGGVRALLSFQETSGAFAYMRPPGNPEVRLMATLEALTTLAQPQPDLTPCRWLYLPLVLRSN